MKIYLAAFPTGGGSGRVHGSTRGGDVLGSALAEDGTGLASHLSSSVGFARHDMGLTSDWTHEYYREYCPDGFELEWVDDPETHAGWQAALALNRALAPKEADGEPEAVGAVDPSAADSGTPPTRVSASSSSSSDGAK